MNLKTPCEVKIGKFTDNIIDADNNNLATIGFKVEEVKELVRRANAYDDFMELLVLCTQDYVSQTDWLVVAQKALFLQVKYREE